MHKISRLKVFFLLFFISFIIYSNSLSGAFLFDDYLLIVGSEDIKHIHTIPSLFTRYTFNYSLPAFGVSYNYYRPLSSLLYALNYQVWKLNPLGYHLTNIFIHSLNAFLVFYLIKKIFANYSIALLSSLLFCVHPIQVESVSYISSLAELLGSLFFLLTIINYISYTESKRGIKYLLAILSFALSLIARETGFLVFIPFIILIIGLKAKLSKVSILMHFLVFASIFVTYIRLRLSILVPIQSLPNSPFPFMFDILNFSSILIEYIKLLMFPYNLHIFRSITPVSLSHPASIVLPILFLLLLLSVVVIVIKQRKYILFVGIAWFIFGLAHLIRFMLKFYGRITMEEHWMYLASAGFFLCISFLILSIKRIRLAYLVSIFLVITYGSLTFINSRHWKDEMSFYRYNLKLVNPALSTILRLNFSSFLSKNGFNKEAIDQVNYILSFSPDNLLAHIQLGDIFYTMKKYPEAKKAYEKAIKIDYFCWQANRKLKLIAQEQGGEFQNEIDPKLPSSEAKIVSLIRIGDFDKAIEAIDYELLKSPAPQFYTLYGITFGKMGLYNQAIEAFNSALKLDPGNQLALYNLAVIYENLNERRKLNEVRKKISLLKQP